MLKEYLNALKLSVRILLAFAIVIQGSLSMSKFFQRDITRVTLVEPEQNTKFQHPFYTVCPILSQTTRSKRFEDILIENTSTYPTVNFFGILNSKTLEVKKTTTYAKMFIDQKRRLETLVQCFTFEILNDVTPGQPNGKLILQTLSSDLDDQGNVNDFEVIEYRIFIHRKEGYFNTFLLNEGKPDLIISGIDVVLGAQLPNVFYYEIKTKLMDQDIGQNCDADPKDDCIENDLESKMGGCKLPWKRPGSNVRPCPPCDWPDEETTCHFFTAGIFQIDYCYLKDASIDCVMTGNSTVQDACILCDEMCSQIPKEQICPLDDHQLYHALPNIEKQKDWTNLGCKKPCSFFRYETREVEVTTAPREIVPSLDKMGFIILELSTEDVETEKEILAYSFTSLLSDIGGSIGILTGLSLLSTFFPTSSHAKSVAELFLVGFAMFWVVKNFNDFEDNKIRQERVGSSTEAGTSALERPFLTLCPNYMYLTAHHIDAFINIRKFELLARSNFLIKSFDYKGSWRRKWNYQLNSLLQFTFNGHVCYTYHPDNSQLAKSKMELEFDREGLTELKGYLHDFDTRQHAFLHKSSKAKFTLAYDDPKYNGTAPNSFTFHVTVQRVKDFRTSDCHSFENNPEDYQPTDEKLHLYLEDQLGCKLPWKLEPSDPEPCPKCQFPFVHNGNTYESCTSEDAARPWCPTAVYRNRLPSYKKWEFCPQNLSCFVHAKDRQNDIEQLCDSKQSLVWLVKQMPDLSRMNPKTIARFLASIDSPFSCTNLDYNADLHYKWHDPELEPNRVKLTILFPDANNDEQLLQDIVKDLDYNADMYISDIGNSFGLLLGLSLIDLIFKITSSVKKIFSIKIRWFERLFHLFVVLKWLAVLITVLVFIGRALSRDFFGLIPFAADGDDVMLTMADLNPDDSKIMLNVDVSNNKSEACPFKDDMGDGWCDDRANIQDCNFDNGDCCNPGAAFNPNSHEFCTNCTCHADQINWEDISFIKDYSCALCIFPFRNPRTGILEEDCIMSEIFGSYSCPMAIYRDTLEPVGIPLEAPCPGESCFVTEIDEPEEILAYIELFWWAHTTGNFTAWNNSYGDLN